jgi:hypothetical protein
MHEGRAAAIDARWKQSGDKRNGKKGQERNPDAEPDQQRHPGMEDDRHMYLRMNLAIAFIVLVFPVDGDQVQISRNWRRGRRLGLIVQTIFQFVRPIVDVLQRAASNQEEGPE